MAKRGPKRPAFTDEHVAEALRLSGGIMAEAARKLGVTRAAVSARVRNSAKLQALRSEVTEEFIDKAESVLLGAVRSGQLSAAMFVLRTLGKMRGWHTRVEGEGDLHRSPMHLSESDGWTEEQARQLGAVFCSTEDEKYL